MRENIYLRLVEASRWNKLYLLVLMAITTGARRGELLNLEVGDLDLDKQTAYVLTSKNGEPKVLPLTQNVIKELERFSLNDNSYNLSHPRLNLINLISSLSSGIGCALKLSL